MVFRAYNQADGTDVGHAIAEARANGDAFDGVCCVNDYTAFGVIRGLADRDVRVPDDVKVTGFDGTSFGGYSTPTLTTIEVDFEQLARLTLDMLIRRVGQRNEDAPEDPPTRATIGFALVERGSTAV